MKKIILFTTIYSLIIIILSTILYIFFKTDKIGSSIWDYFVFTAILSLTISLILFLINRRAYSVFGYSLKKFMYRMKPKSLQNIQSDDEIMNPKTVKITPDTPYQFGSLFLASVFVLFIAGIISVSFS